MSELKATRITMVYNGEIYEDFETVPCTQLYYSKSEADKVIAEKDKEIVKLKEQVALLQAELAQNQEYHNG